MAMAGEFVFLYFSKNQHKANAGWGFCSLRWVKSTSQLWCLLMRCLNQRGDISIPPTEMSRENLIWTIKLIHFKWRGSFSKTIMEIGDSKITELCSFTCIPWKPNSYDDIQQEFLNILLQENPFKPKFIWWLTFRVSKFPSTKSSSPEKQQSIRKLTFSVSKRY